MEIVLQEILLNSEVWVVVFIFRKAGEVLNFNKDRLCLLVPLGIWKIFRTGISCTPAASYFYYYVMPRSFLLDTRVFSLYLFRWCNIFGETFSEAWDHNTLHWLPEKRYYSTVHIASVCYVQAVTHVYMKLWVPDSSGKGCLLAF